jgi:hypothetical protein
VANFAEFLFRDCPKSLGGACNVALRATETVLFGSFWPPCTGQIHDRNVTRTPFRTVSPRRWVNKGNKKSRGSQRQATPSNSKNVAHGGCIQAYKGGMLCLQLVSKRTEDLKIGKG